MGVELPTSITTAIARGATLLTATQRAARTLRHAFDLAQQASGRSLWQPPRILALDTWLETLHRTLVLNGHESRLLLNPTQQHALWRSVIEQDADLPALQSADSLADLATRAARLLDLYGGSASAREFNLATDTRAFAAWSRAFDRQAARLGFLTSAQLPGVLLEALSEGTLELPALALIDFDQLPPATANLFDSIQRAGYDVETIRTTTQPRTAELHIAADDAAELLAAAHWVRARLDRDPTASIAVVVPNLEARRAAIDRVFAQVLAPDLQSILSIEPFPYEFSLGISLAQTAPIAAALSLLRWPAEPLPLATISTLLLSPFCAASEGATAPATLAAAVFDAQSLRQFKLLRPELTLEAFAQFLRDTNRLPRLAFHLRHLQQAAENAPDRQPHTAWADHFRALLEAAGWTAATVAQAYPMHVRWEAVLDELATLDFQGPEPTRADALSALTSLARQIIFAPESRRAPVQILGTLELGGLPFTDLWFLGADDLAWPPPASPSPLIPFALQRTLAMPATDAARDTTQARALTARIAQSAARVVFSFAQSSDEGHRRPSPTLEPLNLESYQLFAIEPVADKPPLTLESIPDLIPLPPLPGRVFPGGARILELQAACPFRAFAELRLRASEPEPRTPGLTPLERGIQVHHIMEAFWREAQSQQDLRDLPEPARHALLDRSITAALAATPLASEWDEAYLEVQHQRLHALLRPWLERELERPAFAVTDSERNLKDVRIGPLRLDLRVDRIDLTAGGSLILDYKTGPAEPKDWLSDRPDAPQLPLYAVIAATDPANDFAGIAFANLRAGKDLALKGFARSTAVLAKPAALKEAANLDDQVDLWRDHLTALATAFAAGDTRVAPKSYPHTCARCTQRILCRLDPTTLTDFDDEPELDPTLDAASWATAHD